VEVDSERQSGVGEHSAAVVVKRRRKVRLAVALRRRGPARGAAPGAVDACAARGGWKAGGTRRSDSWRGAGGRRFNALSGRRQARAVGRGQVGRASPSQCGFGPVTKQRLDHIEQWAGSSSTQYFSNYLRTAPIL
jgi:hypothetical protein